VLIESFAILFPSRRHKEIGNELARCLLSGLPMGFIRRLRPKSTLPPGTRGLFRPFTMGQFWPSMSRPLVWPPTYPIRRQSLSNLLEDIESLYARAIFSASHVSHPQKCGNHQSPPQHIITPLRIHGQAKLAKKNQILMKSDLLLSHRTRHCVASLPRMTISSKVALRRWHLVLTPTMTFSPTDPWTDRV
jgi:hypothetical protein